ncbi:MAG: N-acetylmuramoyl-L-alanine amidase [Anaerolineae bacterium]
MIRKEALKGAQRILIAVMVAIALAIAYLILHALWVPERRSARSTPVAVALTPTAIPTATRMPPTPTPTKPPQKIGIVAGHWSTDSQKYDPGAVCPDGLTEGEINLAIAQLVKALLENQGYEVDLLEEFDAALEGYLADVLVSIHADSCDVPRASGFKVASVLHSALPEEEDRLVKCLREEYQEATSLSFHEHSITYDMREYHAFYEIASQTPGAIIETGFMAADRQILLGQQDKVAQGIANGIVCFLETETD